MFKKEIKQSHEKQWKKQKSKYKYNDTAWLSSQYASYTTYISVYQWKIATITQIRQITESRFQSQMSIHLSNTAKLNNFQWKTNNNNNLF